MRSCTARDLESKHPNNSSTPSPLPFTSVHIYTRGREQPRLSDQVACAAHQCRPICHRACAHVWGFLELFKGFIEVCLRFAQGFVWVFFFLSLEGFRRV